MYVKLCAMQRKWPTTFNILQECESEAAPPHPSTIAHTISWLQCPINVVLLVEMALFIDPLLATSKEGKTTIGQSFPS
jgi:hypothetical protein